MGTGFAEKDMLTLSLFIKNAVGWLVAHWRIVALIAAGIALVVLIGLAYRGCSQKEIKFNQQEVTEAQQAIEAADRDKQIAVLAKSDAKEAVADETAINANAATVNAIHESREKWNQATDAEIQAEIERRLKP